MPAHSHATLARCFWGNHRPGRPVLNLPRHTSPHRPASAVGTPGARGPPATCRHACALPVTPGGCRTRSCCRAEWQARTYTCSWCFVAVGARAPRPPKRYDPARPPVHRQTGGCCGRPPPRSRPPLPILPPPRLARPFSHLPLARRWLGPDRNGRHHRRARRDQAPTRPPSPPPTPCPPRTVDVHHAVVGASVDVALAGGVEGGPVGSDEGAHHGVAAERLHRAVVGVGDHSPPSRVSHPAVVPLEGGRSASLPASGALGAHGSAQTQVGGWVWVGGGGCVLGAASKKGEGRAQSCSSSRRRCRPRQACKKKARARLRSHSLTLWSLLLEMR